VREGTCAAATNTRAGNVDGFSTPYSFDGETFASGPIDTSGWNTGMYCFVFNPRETGNEPNMRLTREFYLGRLGAVGPAEAYNPVGTTHTVTVSISVAVAGVLVDFTVTGANPTSGSASTDANGDASFIWTGTNPGTDTVSACVGSVCSVSSATKYWLELGALSPVIDFNPVGSDHTVSVDLNIAIAGVSVLFEVTGTNATNGYSATDGNGTASFTWTGGLTGTDVVNACLDVDVSGTCDTGEPAATAMATKKWYDASVTGGGQIIAEDPTDNRGNKPFRISFGGHLYRVAGDLICEWQVNFHNVSDDSLDKAQFHADSCSALNTYNWNVTPADGIVNFKAHGTLNGEPGYYVMFRMEDRTEPSVNDTIRIELHGPTSYDTHWGDFPDESDNVGTARTSLDNGNIQIWWL
jgi:hypothetical protein